MGTLHDFSPSQRQTLPQDAIARIVAEAFPLPAESDDDAAATILRPAIVALPLVPCNGTPAPDWSLVRMDEDRFRLTVAAGAASEEDISVRIEGGLLHVDRDCRRTPDDGKARSRPALRSMFLLLEPLHLVGYGIVSGRLYVDLKRDHATPCRMNLPPRLRETAALALAA